MTLRSDAIIKTASGHTTTQPHIAILMATYNGARTIDQQLTSLSGQTYRNWSLIVSDDGSKDDTLQKVGRFRQETTQHVVIANGPRQGFAQNFLHLIRTAGPHVPFVALSDQDDYWHPEKLHRAITQVARLPAHKPVLYTGRTVICDQSLRPLRQSPLFRRPPSFRNALVQNIGGGNTMVVNRAALDILQQTSSAATSIVAHDWWIYQIVAGAGGTVIYDPVPSVFYRQHTHNLIGANDTLTAKLRRFGQLAQGDFQTWTTGNLAALHASSAWLTPESRRTLSEFRKARNGTALSRLRALHSSRVYRQSRLGNGSLLIATLAGLV